MSTTALLNKMGVDIRAKPFDTYHTLQLHTDAGRERMKAIIAKFTRSVAPAAERAPAGKSGTRRIVPHGTNRNPAVVAAVQAMVEPFDQVDLQEATGLDQGQVWNMVRRWRREDWLRQCPNGTYVRTAQFRGLLTG